MNFKFGLLYAKAGQRTDDEMFSNGKKILKVVMIFVSMTSCSFMDIVILIFKNRAVPNLTNFSISLVKG